MTNKTLRHYDRIGLVKPEKKDKWTNYRYYTEDDIVRLHAVKALRLMDLPLREIKQVLEYDDIRKIIDFLTEAEKKAGEKIAALQYSKSKIQSAKLDYEKKIQQYNDSEEPYIKEFPSRIILLSDTIETPTLDKLWSYLRHFYNKIDSAIKDQFSFEDLAGIYTENGISKMFAVCIRYASIDGLKELPEGKYLCANCTEENQDAVLRQLLHTVQLSYGSMPTFSVQYIVMSGILQWNYQIQIPLQKKVMT